MKAAGVSVRGLQEISDFLDLGPGTVRVLLGVAACLTAAALIRGLLLWRRGDDEARRRWRSLLTWWALFGLLVIMLAVGRDAVALVAAALSIAALRESASLTGPRRLFPVAAALAVALYLLAWWNWQLVFVRALPAIAALLVLGELAWRGWLRPRLSATRSLVIAVLPAVLGPASLLAVASLPAPTTRPDERLGWLVLLILLTGLNDMAQAWWGRPFGSRPMAPVLSPGKTWEGLVGGLLTTVLAAVIVAPMVSAYGTATPAGVLEIGPSWAGPDAALDVAGGGPAWIWSLAVGLLVGLAGVAGDLAVSALKRHAGVKDSGDVLPGQGGLLDRFDSLSVAGPTFFCVTWLLWFRGP